MTAAGRPAIIIRREAADDVTAIAAVHASAFRSADVGAEPVEVGLVEQLRRSPAWLPALSLVATIDDRVVGHVVCTRAHVGEERFPALGLGPLGVRPELQGLGVGAALMHAVLGAAEALDETIVGVLGESDYYGRFGFVLAAPMGIIPPDPSWADYFQVRRLGSGQQARGRFTYAPPFEGL